MFCGGVQCSAVCVCLTASLLCSGIAVAADAAGPVAVRQSVRRLPPPPAVAPPIVLDIRRGQPRRTRSRSATSHHRLTPLPPIHAAAADHHMRTAAAQPAPSVPSTPFFLPMRWQWAATVATTVALCLCVASTLPVVVAVPFASLSPQPTLQSFPLGYSEWFDENAFCVLNASGRGISSITAADLAQFTGWSCGSEPLNAIDLR